MHSSRFTLFLSAAGLAFATLHCSSATPQGGAGASSATGGSAGSSGASAAGGTGGGGAGSGGTATGGTATGGNAGSSGGVGGASGSGGSSGSSGNTTPLGGAQYAGSLLLNDTGAQLASWNDTANFCASPSWQVADGTVATSGSNLTLSTSGVTGSCVAIKSPGTYSSVVIEADIDFPALSSNPSMIADWTSLWLTNQATWPTDGELDAVEAEPVDGINAVAWHWGSSGSQQWVSTDGWGNAGTLPKNGANLSPGWHTVDIVYTQGFMAVYYDGHQYTSYTNGSVTGSALNIILSTSITPNTSAIQQQLGGPPVNSDSSPATITLKYLKIWSYK